MAGLYSLTDTSECMKGLWVDNLSFNNPKKVGSDLQPKFLPFVSQPPTTN